MKREKQKKSFNVQYEKRSVPVSMIDAQTELSEYDKKDIRNRAAYFLLNGVPEFAVNEKIDGRFTLLAADRDFYAAKSVGATEITVRIYQLSEKNAEAFSCVERLKTERLAVMEEAYLMQKLVKEYAMTQDDVAALVGKSRPAIANTLRLLTLSPEVIGLVESGKLSAGHARTLVKVPAAQQRAFAEEAIKREYSVREMERAVKMFLTPPEIMQQEKQAMAAAKSAELKALVERLRGVFRTKVSLIGSDKKGRIYIDYYSQEDLYRFEEFLEIIENNR